MHPDDFSESDYVTPPEWIRIIAGAIVLGIMSLIVARSAPAVTSPLEQVGHEMSATISSAMAHNNSAP